VEACFFLTTTKRVNEVEEEDSVTKEKRERRRNKQQQMIRFRVLFKDVALLDFYFYRLVFSSLNINACFARFPY